MNKNLLRKNYELKKSKNNERENRKKYNYFNDNIIKDFENFEKIKKDKFIMIEELKELYQSKDKKSYILEFENYYILIRDNIEKSFFINKFFYIEKFEKEEYQKMNLLEFIKEKNFIIIEDYKINDKMIIILNHNEDIIKKSKEEK